MANGKWQMTNDNDDEDEILASPAFEHMCRRANTETLVVPPGRLE
jgi:hypothetical protein